MDDLSSKISEILSDPHALEQIKGLSSMLNIGDATPQHHQTSTKSEPSSNALAGLLGGDNSDMLSMISKLTPLIKNINKEDDTTRLLLALRPFLSAERQKKLDETGKIIKMMKLLPLLKDFSLFDSLF